MKLASRLLALLILLAVGVGYGGLCYFQVEPNAQAVILRLGAYHRTVSPGPHFHIFGLDTIEKRRLTIQREEFGFRTVSAEGGEYEGRPHETSMVTNEGNVVDVPFVVEYRIADLEDYLFRLKDTAETIRDAAQASVREVVSQRPVDDVLQGSKTVIEVEARERLQAALDAYQAGVRIETVQLQDVRAPKSVRDAFRDVLAASQDRERAILEARGYRDQIVPRARGEKEAAINRARAYLERRILEAQGEAERFTALLVEYRRAPGVTRDRLYIETLEAILPGMDKVIIEGEAGENLLPYIPLGRKGPVR